MAGIGLCRSDDCIHKDICKRYKETIGEEYLFKNICNEDNNYQWLWKIENSIIESEEKK